MVNLSELTKKVGKGGIKFLQCIIKRPPLIAALRTVLNAYITQIDMLSALLNIQLTRLNIFATYIDAIIKLVTGLTGKIFNDFNLIAPCLPGIRFELGLEPGKKDLGINAFITTLQNTQEKMLEAFNFPTLLRMRERIEKGIKKKKDEIENLKNQKTFFSSILEVLDKLIELERAEEETE